MPFGCPFTHGLAFRIIFCVSAEGDILPSFDSATAKMPDTVAQAGEVPLSISRARGPLIPEGNVGNQMGKD